MITMFAYALAIAITAVVYSHILVQPGEILSRWMQLLEKLFRNDMRYSAGKGMHPVFKILIGCTKCVSGQMMLWFMVCVKWPEYSALDFSFLPLHIMAICITIFFATTIKSLYEKYTSN